MTDNYMKKAMEEYKVPNLTLSVVKDGKIYFKKGYGYADLEKKIPVNPDTTAFEIGSVTKLFTATAAMQLVEQGKLNLNEDVNNYLSDFKIKNKFSKPVTLENLLTHTAGFDEKLDHSLYPQDGTEFYEKIQQLGDYLKKELPSIIREPGTCVQYSNHSYALIGYLVGKTSGISFDKYITDNIFNKLNMKNTFYFLNKDNVNNMAKPYKYQKGKFVPTSYSIVIDNPAGSICSTASDMANFMLMHINNGEYQGHKILMTDTAKKMHSTSFTNEFYKFFTKNETAASTPAFNNENMINSFDTKKIPGLYTGVRYPHNDIFKIASIIPFLQTKVNVDKSGNIILPIM